jgi:hypothetical protein
MADFTTPFGSNSGRRSPSNDEKINGFPCGPADLQLFNGLFHRLEAEIGNIISFAGLVGSDGDLTQLRKAVEAMIDTATGGGNTSTYLLMSQARARLPIYPEIVGSDNKLNVSSPTGGVIRVPGGVSVIHRGVYEFTSAQTDFNTVANKTYHLRWNPTNGFTLNDLSNGTYNTSGLLEIDPAFDTHYDDMLVSRVITNSSNVATITNLKNAHDIRAVGENVAAKGSLGDRVAEGAAGFGMSGQSITQGAIIDLNFARRPDGYIRWINDVETINNTGEFNFGIDVRSRYQLMVWGQGDVDINIGWGART